MTPFQAYVAGAVAGSLWDLRATCDVWLDDPLTEATEEPTVTLRSRKTGETIIVRITRA